MAVSDTAANPLDNIRVVLVGTLYTGNVGSSCRAMANMGIRHLRLAAPNLQNSWEEGERLAVHATDILAAREEFPSLEAAVADCVAVVGTTAREGLYRQHVKAPRDCAADILSVAATGPVALVFGREDKGLLNEEIAQCTHLVRIPVDEGYTSLNLSQAVLVACYELFLRRVRPLRAAARKGAAGAAGPEGAAEQKLGRHAPGDRLHEGGADRPLHAGLPARLLARSGDQGRCRANARRRPPSRVGGEEPCVTLPSAATTAASPT